MSGGNIPYHLRQNKAIDRNLFIELLAKLNRYRNISDYIYIGFGGPFLEDFKAIHAYSGINQMISIEMNAGVYKRQRFNLPLNCIDCRLTASEQFLKDYSFDRNTIVWLDYTEPRKLGAQLNEIEFLFTRLQAYDIVKVTLNANANALADRQGLKEDEDLNEKRLKVLKQRAGRYLPPEVSEDMVTNDEYPSLLCKAVENAAKRGMTGKSRFFFQPLTAFIYADSMHKMLTLTGMILPDENEEIERFFRDTGIKSWPLSTQGNRPITSRIQWFYVQDFKQIVSIPTGLQPLGLNAAFQCFFLL